MKCLPHALLRIPVILAVALFFGSAVSSHAIWQLSWSDEFNGATIDTTKWAFETGNNGGWGNSEREYYTGRSANAYVTNGVLHIVARQESFGGFPYTSARMKTQGLFSKKYGRIEFSARLPQGLGYWPALWMLGTNIVPAGWPACGEIDVLENNQSLGNQVQGTLHYSDSGNNHLSQTRVYTLPTRGDSVTNFHTYAVEWTTNSIKWLVDSNLVQTWTSWSSSTGPYPAPFNQPFFILLNLAVGGSYVGYPTDAQINAGTAFPGELQVDWVRVYDDVPVAAAPTAPTGVNIGQGQAKAFLSWDATSGATGYKVKRAAASGGSYATIGSPATNGYVDTGVSTCSTYYYVISATNSFGESTNSAESAITLGALALAVNSGGNASAQFGADAYFVGGTQAGAVTTTIDTSGLNSPAPQDVYQTERYGNFTYTFTNLTSGLNYKVRLHFAETYWTAPGQRRFNVLINGVQVLTNFDIVAVAGAATKANIQEFQTIPNSGQIVIQYVTVTDNAKASGIEVQLPPPPAPAAGCNGPLYETSTLNLTASTVPNATYNWLGPNGFASTNQNPSIPNVTTNSAGVYTVIAIVNGCPSLPASVIASVNSRPLLSLQFSGDLFSLVWSTGTLQSATNLTGPWSDVSGAVSPTNIAPSGPQQFFRIKL